MKLIPILASLLCLPLVAQEPITKLACGSCYNPKRDKGGVWKTLAAEKPQAFLFMGDNIYADTSDMELMKKKWAQLTSREDYAAFTKAVPIYATWDDHDYGKNDVGREYDRKAESQKIFQDVFKVPADDPSRKTEGIYHSKILGPEGKRLQLILLDTRYFRSANKQQGKGRNKTYIPQIGESATMLGDAQWKWLEEELKKPAELRLIVTSIQLIATVHRFEKWANMPDEKERFIRLLRETKAGPTVLLSGDRHLAEVCKIDAAESGLPYDLYELTTSGMSHAGAQDLPSPYRVKGTYSRKANFGVIDIDWSAKKPAVTLRVKEAKGALISETKVTFP